MEMNRKRIFFVASFIVLALALPSQAAVITDELAMTLTFDGAGNATLTNNTGSAVNVDVYEIWSAGNNLDPVGWESIADAVVVRPLDVMNGLGAGALSFGELTATTGLLAEGNLSNSAAFQPAAAWSIGKPFDPGQTAEDLTFYYARPETPGDKYLGEIVPEPATMGLLAVGGVLTLLRRRRRR
jgi:hypothetical protein